MHEASLVARILECAIDIAEQHGGHPIRRVSLEIGALQQVVPEALMFAFEAARSGTLAERAVLDWREIPARIACAQCRAEYTPEDVFWVCPACAAPGGKVLAGDDIVLSEMELEDGEETEAPGD